MCWQRLLLCLRRFCFEASDSHGWDILELWVFAGDDVVASSDRGKYELNFKVLWRSCRDFIECIFPGLSYWCCCLGYLVYCSYSWEAWVQQE